MKADDFLSENALYEMSNYGPTTTGLPNGIVMWVRTETTTHGHSIYRIKISKNREDAGIYTVGQRPAQVKDINRTITTSEDQAIKKFIANYSSLLITHIDGKLDSSELGMLIKKDRGEKL